MELNTPVVCGNNIFLNIFVLMDLRMMIFIKHYLREFVIIAIYVDDLNIIGTSNAIEDVVAMLRCQFEMKDLDLTTFCLGLQIEHLSNGILLH